MSRAQGDTVAIRTTTLDSYLTEAGIPRVRFLKCDIEGHEPNFLAGAKEALQRGTIEWLLIEYNGWHLGPAGFSVLDFAALLENFGYRPVALNLHFLQLAQDPTHRFSRAVFNLLFSRQVD